MTCYNCCMYNCILELRPFYILSAVERTGQTVTCSFIPIMPDEYLYFEMRAFPDPLKVSCNRSSSSFCSLSTGNMCEEELRNCNLLEPGDCYKPIERGKVIITCYTFAEFFSGNVSCFIARSSNPIPVEYFPADPGKSLFNRSHITIAI